MRVTLKDRSSSALQTYAVATLVGAVAGWVCCLIFGSGGGGGGGSFHDSSLLSSSSLSQSVPADVHHRRTWNDKSTGWSLAHIFYGTTDHLPMNANVRKDVLKCNTWFSQARQDELVFNLLHGKRGGYFVDLAANDALLMSNTFSLEHFFGWNGLCIEPNPLYWPGLSYRKCDLVAAVVARDREEVHFRFSNKEFGGIVGEKFDNKGTKKENPRLTVTLVEVLKRFNSPNTIDYMSLDVEGAEDVVMQPAVLDTYQFNLLTIERPSKDLQKLLESKGYKVLKVLTPFGDTLFVRNSFESQLNKTALDAVDTMNYKQYENLKWC